MIRALPFLALALAACATLPSQPAGPTAAIGQTAIVGNVAIRPLSVVEDSRCRKDVQCIWAGRIVILAEIDLSGGSETWRGHLTLGDPTILGRETVTLAAAAPEKSAAAPTSPRAYRFTFAVTRTP